MTLTEHLDRARALARRKGHARVSSVHILLSLSNMADVQRHMAEHGYSLARLERFMRDALAAEPEARAYRDAPEPVIDVGLEPILANAVMELALFEALIAPFAAQLRFDDAPLRRFADEVTAAAAATGHPRALVEHALYALARRATDGGRFADALARIGYQRRDFRHHIAERIAMGAPSSNVSSFAEIKERAIAHANISMREVLTTDALVVDLLRVPATRQALEAVAVSYPSLLFAYVHGGVPPPLPAVNGAAEVVLYADPFTPIEAVADVLSRYFGQPPETAMALAHAMRTQGYQTLSADGRAGAHAVASARGECAEQGWPLRIELRPA